MKIMQISHPANSMFIAFFQPKYLGCFAGIVEKQFLCASFPTFTARCFKSKASGTWGVVVNVVTLRETNIASENGW